MENSKVKIIQEWDKKRPSIKQLLHNFRRYLIDEKIKNELKSKKYNQKIQSKFSNKTNETKWIEKLLQTPIADYRKNAVSLILAPYLINIKKLSYQESFDILIEWLHNCESTRKLDFNPTYLIKYALNIAIKKRIPPMKFETLKNRDLNLYLKINEQRLKF